MGDFRKIFSKYGFSLFEGDSTEQAIVDAIKNHEIRYILGIPTIIEKAAINFDALLSGARQAGVLEDLLEILSIASRLIKDRKKAAEIKKLLRGKKSGNKFDESDFRQVYGQYSKISSQKPGFPSGMHYHLSFIFAHKQIDILYKLSAGGRLSKTENEYYSRIIKKKLVAIRELFPFVKEILVKG